ncbi:hypothetical protein IEO21_06187 [Rhodonia placenta]|uniref:Uncharacterized protein n=1 Tax=Rhodonia placenta TaxID=104341 RepID=A0A8H7U0U6_9APHY|nr:hypothetical protein IEO21_06187 [Postia placenta]
MYSQPLAVRAATHDLIQLSIIDSAGQYAAQRRRASERRPRRPNRYDVVYRRPYDQGVTLVDDDAESCWEYRPPRRAIARLRTTSRSTDSTTPAQAYAANYRQRSDRRDAYSSGVSAMARPSTSSNDAPSTSMAADVREARPRHRQSRAEAHGYYLGEAYRMYRVGCNAILPSIIDLARHLYMHDISVAEWPTYSNDARRRTRWRLRLRAGDRDRSKLRASRARRGKPTISKFATRRLTPSSYHSEIVSFPFQLELHKLLL